MHPRAKMHKISFVQNSILGNVTIGNFFGEPVQTHFLSNNDYLIVGKTIKVNFGLDGLSKGNNNLAKVSFKREHRPPQVNEGFPFLVYFDRQICFSWERRMSLRITVESKATFLRVIFFSLTVNCSAKRCLNNFNVAQVNKQNSRNLGCNLVHSEQVFF